MAGNIDKSSTCLNCESDVLACILQIQGLTVDYLLVFGSAGLHTIASIGCMVLDFFTGLFLFAVEIVGFFEKSARY